VQDKKMEKFYGGGELPTIYNLTVFEVGASRLIVAFSSQRKLTELSLLFQKFFCYANANKRNPSCLMLINGIPVPVCYKPTITVERTLRKR